MDATIAGYCEILQSQGAWSRNWCVLHQNCLYLYQSKESKNSIRTVALQQGIIRHVIIICNIFYFLFFGRLGYIIKQIQLQEKEFTLSLQHSQHISLVMAIGNQTELMNWYKALNVSASSSSSSPVVATTGQDKQQTGPIEHKPVEEEDSSATTSTTSTTTAATNQVMESLISYTSVCATPTLVFVCVIVFSWMVQSREE